MNLPHIGRWLRRDLFLTKLRRCLRSTVVTRAYVRFYAFDCTDDEVSEIQTIDEDHLLAVGRVAQRWLGVSTRMPRIVVACFGRSTRYQLVTPREFASYLGYLLSDSGDRAGYWYEQVKAVVAVFQDDLSLRTVVVHELVHALLDILTDGFPYPSAVQEGFAILMHTYGQEKIIQAGCFMNGSDGERVQERDGDKAMGETSSRRRRFLSPSTHISVRELLLYDIRKQRRRTTRKITRYAFWLNSFLAWLSRTHPEVGRILPELRSKNIRTPDGVYEWIQKASGMSMNELERRFFLYCTAGVPPTDDAPFDGERREGSAAE